MCNKAIDHDGTSETLKRNKGPTSTIPFCKVYHNLLMILIQVDKSFDLVKMFVLKPLYLLTL